MEIKKYTRYLLLVIALSIIALDQITKSLIKNSLALYEVKPYLPFWNWTLIYNRGAAFSLLDRASGWQKPLFAGFAIIVSLIITYYLLRRSYTFLTGLALSFVLGGAVGNLIDRIRFGQVTDFIDWYYKSYHWPSFNLADSFITCGVMLLIIEAIFSSNIKDDAK